MKKFALVLGGGASKGYAHVGVLKVLEENGIKPDLIVGTSMGAMVGGMYALGKTISELENMAFGFKSIGRFSLSTTLSKGHLLNVDKVKSFLIKNAGDEKIESCNIKFASVATDLGNAKSHVFKHGKIRDAIMASISIPCLFPNFVVNGKEYCDGGLTDQVPEDIAKKLMPDAIIISVDPLGDYTKQKESNKLKLVETALNASMIMVTNNVLSKGILADLRISISQPEVSQTDFSKKTAQIAIANGEKSCKKYIKRIKELLSEG